MGNLFDTMLKRCYTKAIHHFPGDERTYIMNKKSLKITTGAMVTAIFGVMLLLNRQTGGLFGDIFIFLYPIPMVAYGAQYGLKSAAPVLAAMSLLSFLLGNVWGIFYAVTQALIGIIFGGCLHHKVDMTKTLFVVMILSALVTVVDTVVLSTLSGVSLNQEVEEMQKMMNTMFEQAGVAVPDMMLTAGYLKQILVLSMILLGLLQGFVVYEVSLLVLRRLRFPVQKPKSVFLYFPPKWTGYGAFAAFLLYGAKMARPFEQEMIQNVVLTVGVFGYMYLICFGVIAILLTLKVYVPRARIWGVILCIIGVFVFPTMEMAAGVVYIVSGYHRRLLEQM